MTDLGRRVVLDLFAGPGGWSEGLRMHGLTELGIEWDEAACATARAAGHERVQADVAELDPRDIERVGIHGLIASPPCQAWSMAGKGGGRRDVEHVIACALEIAAGNDTRSEHAEKCEDARSMLVVEPLRWALSLRPRWIALEQVPPVLEMWMLFGKLLADTCGYRTWAGVLEAERYGVPQTRERAFLLLHADRWPYPPKPTHQRYVPGQPQRHDYTFEGEVLPWVSMAQALGWREDPLERAAMAVNNDRPSRKAAGAGNKPRPVDAPAATLDSTTRQAVWVHERPATTVAGDPRLFPPRRTDRDPDYKTGDGPVSQANGGRGVRVTVQEAAILQSFRPDYPWTGSRSKQFEQVGNAVPPLLAHAVLGQLIDPATSQEARRAA